MKELLKILPVNPRIFFYNFSLRVNTHSKGMEGRESIVIDAFAAWHIFEKTGKIEDYIRYSQLNSLEQMSSQEVIHADQHRRTGDYGENNRGE